jgi:hypothetical protein
VPGIRTLETYFPGAVVEKNVIVACPFSAQYPRANFFPISLDKVGFEDRPGGNYRLAPASSFRRAATDGKDVGVDFDALAAAAAPTAEARREPCRRGPGE